jgi:hypothetical protein
MKIKKILLIDKLACAIIIFLVGWFSVLPASIPEITLPLFMTKISITHGLFLHDALFILYLSFIIIFNPNKIFIDININPKIKKLATLIFFLGFLVLISNLFNIAFGYEQPLTKIGEGFRLFVVALFVIYIYTWSSKYDGTFVFKNYLLGFFLSGAFHVYYANIFNFRELGGLSGLIGQNGPGPGFALGLLFSAILIYFAKSKNDFYVAFLCLPLSVYGILVSYSKTSMLIGFFGCMILFISFAKTIFNKYIFKKLAFIIILVIVVFNYFELEIDAFMSGAQAYFDYKFGNNFVTENESTKERARYFYTTFKIFINNPFLGAGTGGFYEAVRDVAPEALQYEDDFNDGSANPHNSFLYYTAGSGIIGTFLALVIFIYLHLILFISSKDKLFKIIIIPIIFCIVLLYGFALPSLFNTLFLYIFFLGTYSSLRLNKSIA